MTVTQLRDRLTEIVALGRGDQLVVVPTSIGREEVVDAETDLPTSIGREEVVDAETDLPDLVQITHYT